MATQIKAGEQYFHVVLQLFVFQNFHKRIFCLATKKLQNSWEERVQLRFTKLKRSAVYSLVSTEDLCVSC